MDPRPPIVTAEGPTVGTTVRFPAAGVAASLRMIAQVETTPLAPRLVVELFALGLRTPEPDRTGWVTIAELEIDDRVTFTVGATAVRGDLALEAVRRGIELALATALSRYMDTPDRRVKGEADAADPEP